MFNLREKLKRARESLAAPLARVFQRDDAPSALDTDALEALLLSADVGVDATERVLRALRAHSPADYRRVIRDQFLEMLARPAAETAATPTPRAMLVVGINGAGKTTSIGKLAYFLRGQGHQVIVAACDTFRAAAADQLAIWAQRAGVEIVRHREGGDPAAVAHDACTAAKARGADVVIVDTAGRLHTRANLMEELAKIRRVCQKAFGPDAVATYLVLDATLGQNSLVQAQEFTRRLAADGVILTKLDSTARGGVVIAVAESLGIPVRYIGVGEGIDDFGPFVAEDFVDALLGS